MWYDNIFALTRKYRIYCVDTPGDYGKSRVKVPLRTRKDCADWLAEVMDKLSLDKTHLIGHSMGGWLSLNFSLMYQERVSSLDLLDPVVSFQRLPVKFMFKVYPVMLRPTERKIMQLWKWFLAENKSLHPVVMAHIVKGRMHCKPQLRVVPNVFKASELAKLTAVKTLFLVGDQEVVYNPVKASNRVKTAVPHATAVLVPDAGHCLVTEQSQLVNEKILSFLDQVL